MVQKLRHCLQRAADAAKPLLTEQVPAVPPLTGIVRAGLIGAVLCQVALLIVAALRNRYVLESDALAYMRLAWYYASGQWHLVVSGYWGPLLSWLMVPWIGWTAELVDAARLAMGLSAVVFLVGCLALLRRLCLPPVMLLLGTWLVALATVFWSVQYITPDLLMSGLFCLALSRMLHWRWYSSRLTPWLTGMLCGLAYLAKAIALPATVSCCLGVGMLWLFSQRLPWRQVGRSVVLTMLGCLLVAGPWIAVLSWKYHTPTFSTTSMIAHAVVGPPDVARSHPFRRLFYRPEAGRILAWEDPSTMPYPYWSPVHNLAYAKHQLGLIYANYHHLLTVLQHFDALGIGLFALVSCLLVPGRLRHRLRFEPWRWAVVPVLGLAVWYLPVYAAEQRYYFLAYPLALTASLGLIVSLTHGLRRWRRGALCLGALLVLSSFALPVLPNLAAAWRGLEAPSIAARALATRLQAAQVSGPLVGIDGKEGIYLAFFLNQPWYGEAHHPTLAQLKAVPARLYIIPRHADLRSQLDADPTFRNLDARLFTSAAEAQHYPWSVYQRLTP